MKRFVKTTRFLTLFALFIFIAVFGAQAQFNAGVSVIGISNAPVTVGLIPQTNNVLFQYPAKGLTVLNLISNQPIGGSFGYYASNSVYESVESFTYTNNSSTNGNSFTTNFPATFVYGPLPLAMQINVGSGNTNTVQTQ